MKNYTAVVVMSALMIGVPVIAMDNVRAPKVSMMSASKEYCKDTLRALQYTNSEQRMGIACGMIGCATCCVDPIISAPCLAMSVWHYCWPEPDSRLLKEE